MDETEAGKQKNVLDDHWRAIHGFDNIDPCPDGWPIIK